MSNFIEIKAGIVIIVLALIILSFQLIIGRQFSLLRIRSNMERRVQEIREVLNSSAEREDERIKQIIRDYIADHKLTVKDMIRLTVSQSGLKINFYHFIILTICFTVFGFFLGLSLNNFWLSIFIPIAFSQIMFIVVRLGFYKRQAAFRNHSHEVISQINNLYKTSRNLLMSTLASIDAMPEPFHSLFSVFRRDLQIMPLDEAIDRALQAVIDPNLRLALILIRESEKTGINVEREWQNLSDIYEDEKEIRTKLANEMNKEKTESIILGIIPVVLIFIGFFFYGEEFRSLLHVSWINTMLSIVVSFIIIGFLMLPRIFMLDLE